MLSFLANMSRDPFRFCTCTKPRGLTNFSGIASLIELSRPVRSFAISHNSTNSTYSSTPFANRVIDCECGWIFGRGDYGRSCFDAVQQVAFVPGSATRQFTWGSENGGTTMFLCLRQCTAVRNPNLLRLLLSNEELLSRWALHDIGPSQVRSYRPCESTTGTKWCSCGYQ